MRIERHTGIAALAAAVFLAGAGCATAPAREPAPPPAVPSTTSAESPRRIVRATGTVQAVRSFTVRVPQLAQLSGRNPQLTLTALVPNGSAVKQGDILVEFDPTAQIDEAREAQAKLDELKHQLEEKRAQVHSDSVKRVSLIREAEAELSKAELQLRKGPVLAELDRKKNEVKAASARERLTSMRKAHEYREKAEAASVQVLELKNARQNVVVERLKRNIEVLTVRAPHDGMAALETVWRSGSMGPPQVGDQVWPNQPVVRIFDPTEMVVDTSVNEPDVGVLGNAVTAKVFLDAYPNVSFEARLESASPVATAGLESPVKSFSARFRIAQRDARLLPDLSASLEIELSPAARVGGGL